LLGQPFLHEGNNIAGLRVWRWRLLRLLRLDGESGGLLNFQPPPRHDEELVHGTLFLGFLRQVGEVA
jgi:hypothetical protein